MKGRVDPRRGLPWRELLVAIVYVVGWGLLTQGGALLLSGLAVWTGFPEGISVGRIVWLVSGGLFFLGLGGVGLLKTLFLEGLYVLSIRKGDGD